MLSQKEVGIEVLAITAPFQNCISKNGSDTINDITYIRTSQNTKNSISDQRKSVLKRLLRVYAIVFFSQQLYNTIKKEKPDVLHADAMFFCAILVGVRFVLVGVRFGLLGIRLRLLGTRFGLLRILFRWRMVLGAESMLQDAGCNIFQAAARITF